MEKRMVIRVKAQLKDGKIAVELTDARGRKYNLPTGSTIEIWAAASLGKLYVLDENRFQPYDLITGERHELSTD